MVGVQNPIEVWKENYSRAFPGCPVDMDSVYRRVREIAFHESGHLVMCAVLDMDVKYGSVSIIPDEKTSGRVALGRWLEPENLVEMLKNSGGNFKPVLRHQLLLCLAGCVAEDIVNAVARPYSIFATDWWQEEQETSSDIAKSWRYAEMLASRPWPAERLLDTFGIFTHEILSHKAVSPALEQVAECLIVRGTIWLDDYRGFLGPVKGLGWINKKWFRRLHS
jgi:hypothetical protein